MTPTYRISHLLNSRVLLQYEWGYHAPHSLPNGMSFKVNGVLFQGTVVIKVQNEDDTMTIYLLNKRNEQVRKIRRVTDEELIPILRANIDGSDAWKEIWKKYYKEKFDLKK